MKTDRYIIWRDIALMDFEEEDSFKKETMENYNLSPDDVEEIQDLMYNINENYLYDERYNLSSINLPDTILAIADLGLWSGRCSGYREFDSIQDCLYTNDDGYAEWYVDTYGNFKCMFSHHADETAQAWLRGVVDSTEILHIDIQGLDVLWNLVQEYGVPTAKKMCREV